MTIANVALTNTFDEWRTRTNQMVYILNGIETDNLFTAQSNTAGIYITPAVGRGGTVYISANIATSLSDISTTNIASTNLANVIHEKTIAAFNKANSANYFAYLVNANTVAAFDKANITNSTAVAAFDKANSANYFAYLVNANTVAAFDKANSANYFAYLVNANTVAAFDKANSVNTIAVAANNLATNAAVGTINFLIEGASGQPVSNGTTGTLIIPFNAYISEWTVLSDATSYTTIDIYKTNYTSYSSTLPNASNSITGTEKLVLNSARKNTSTALTGWTNTITTNDVLRFNVVSTTAATKLTIALKITKT